MATNEQHNIGTTRDDTATTTDRALVVAIKGSATEGSIPVTLGGPAGAVTADQGSPAVVADAWPIKVTDGTDTAQVTAGAVAGGDTALVVALKGSATESTIPTTAAQGTPAAVANSWPILVTDGTDTAQVVAAAPALNTNALVVRVLERAATASAVTRVAATAANTTLLAANTSRVSAGFCNNSVSANLYVKLGATASLAAGAESFTVKVAPGGFFRLEKYEYTGIVDGIWDSAEAGAECLITELT